MTCNRHDEIEAIRQLKARYFRFIDTQQWEPLRDCFTADIHCIAEGIPRLSEDLPKQIVAEGPDAMIDGLVALMTGNKSIHHGFMPEIEITSDTTARGIWSMTDYIILPDCSLKGWGHYHEEYEKEGGVWRIKRMHLTRLHTEEVWF